MAAGEDDEALRYLPGERFWRVRTRMGSVLARIPSPTDVSEVGHAIGTTSLLEDLLWEVENQNPEALALVAALMGLAEGPVPRSFSLSAKATTPFAREGTRARLVRAVSRDELRLAPAEVGFLPFEPLAEEPAVEPLPKEEPSFIDLVVVDPTGKAVQNVKVRVELPDGQVHEAWINAHGRLRVDGFTQDGSASVKFLDIGTVPGRSG